MLFVRCIRFHCHQEFNEFNDYYLQGRIQSIFEQTSTYIEPTKVPPWLVLSGEISKMCASRYSKIAQPCSVCS